MRRGRQWRLIPFFLLACLLLSPCSSPPIHGQPRTLEEELARYYSILEQLQELEDDVFSELVNIEYQLADERRRLSLISVQLEQLEAELPALEHEWEQAHERYQEVRVSSQKALRMMQLLGPASYLEILTGAVSLKDFVQRLNSVVVLVRGTMDLLFNLGHTQEVLGSRYERLSAFYEEQRSMHEESQERLIILQRMYEEKEAVLSRLGEERGAYEEALAYTEEAWLEETGQVLQGIHVGFSRVLADVELPIAGVEIVQDGFSLEIRIPATVLNHLIQETPALQGVVMVLDDERADLILPQRLLALSGVLQLAEGARVRLQVEEITVAGAVLSDDIRDELMETVDIVLDFSSLATGVRLRSLQVVPDAVVLRATALIPFISQR